MSDKFDIILSDPLTIKVYVDTNMVKLQYFLSKFPVPLIIEGDFVIKNDFVLPPNTTVTGNLGIDYYWMHDHVQTLPDNLTVYGDMHINTCDLKQLPENLTVGQSLYCVDNQLTRIPSSLRVGENLHCGFNRITEIIRSTINGTLIMDTRQRTTYNQLIRVDKIGHIREKLNNK